jgi:hypothetical protein
VAKVKREVTFDLFELCVDVNEKACRQIIFNGVIDPGIGVMVVGATSDPMFFRVR